MDTETATHRRGTGERRGAVRRHWRKADKRLVNLYRAFERDFLKKDNLQVTIHYDPIVTSDAKVGVLRTRLTEHLRQLDPQPSIHDLRIVPGDTHTNVLFDLAFPAGYTGDTAAVMAEMCRFVTGQDPNYSCIIKLEQSYAAVPQSPK